MQTFSVALNSYVQGDGDCMTDLVQTSADATRSRAMSVWLFSGLLLPLASARVLDTRNTAGSFFFFNVCPVDCTVVAGSGKVGLLNFRLTTPVGPLSFRLSYLSPFSRLLCNRMASDSNTKYVRGANRVDEEKPCINWFSSLFVHKTCIVVQPLISSCWSVGKWCHHHLCNMLYIF